MKAWAKRY